MELSDRAARAGVASVAWPPASLLRRAAVAMRDKEKALAAELAAQRKRIPCLDALLRGDHLKEVRGPSGKVYAGTLGWCHPPWREPRKSAILLVEAKWFDPLILVTILVNCTTMAAESPLDLEGTTKKA